MGYYGSPYGMGYSPYGPAGMPGGTGMQQPQQCQITRVNGRNGADAFRMAPNSTILLLDENDPIVWLKQTDGAGYATVTPYQVSPYKPETPVNVSELENRVKRLEERLNAKPDDANAGQPGT